MMRAHLKEKSGDDVTTVIGVVFMIIAVCVFIWGFNRDMNKAAFVIGFITLLLGIISFMVGAKTSSVTNNYYYQINDSTQQDGSVENWTGNDATDDGAGEFQLTRPPMSTPRIEDDVNDGYLPFDDFE